MFEVKHTYTKNQGRQLIEIIYTYTSHCVGPVVLHIELSSSCIIFGVNLYCEAVYSSLK